MTIPKEIIELAIKGGWMSETPNIQMVSDDLPYSVSLSETDGVLNRLFYFEEIICDPEFWKALGKEKGWNKKTMCETCFLAGFYALKDCSRCWGEWFLRARDYYSLVLFGDNTQQFWEEIMK